MTSAPVENRTSVQLRTRDRRLVTGMAELARPSRTSQYAKATGVLGVSLALGLGSLVIPVAHFVLPWAIPLAGLFAAYQLVNIRIIVGTVHVTCPECSKPGDTAPFGVFESPAWLRCPHCQAPLELLPPS